MPKTHIEYRLYRRIVFKNGNAGNWIDEGVHKLKGVGGIKWHIGFCSEFYGKGGRKVEFKVSTREVTDWCEPRPLTEDEMKGVDNAK